MGGNLPVYLHDIPTVFISVANPYHLLDVPRVKTFINAYGSHPVMLETIVDKLMGRGAFTGKSPVGRLLRQVGRPLVTKNKGVVEEVVQYSGFMREASRWFRNGLNPFGMGDVPLSDKGKACCAYMADAL